MTLRTGVLIGVTGVVLTAVGVLWLADRVCEAGRL